MIPILLIGFVSLLNTKPHIAGKVVDQSGSPVSFARVSSGDCFTSTDINGVFFLNSQCDSLTINALSFEQIKLPVSDCSDPIVLQPKHPKNVRTMK